MLLQQNEDYDRDVQEATGGLFPLHLPVGRLLGLGDPDWHFPNFLMSLCPRLAASENTINNCWASTSVHMAPLRVD